MNANRILVVEDEPSVGEVVSLYLTRAGYDVVTVNDGRVAIEMLEKETPQLIVLDLMLPHVDGREILSRVRQRSHVPVIILTALREESDRIAGLEMGADDYITKPFSPQELVSRVKAVLRRGGTNVAAEEDPMQTLKFQDLQINPGIRLVVVNQKEIDLTAKEFNLLLLLVRNPKKVFSRSLLLEQVWGLSDYIDPGTVTVHMRRLREKIEQDPSHPRYIQTVWGVGYRFEP
ncbi:MAG: DNA-binding response regulator [Anaerolinea sp.]|nr:DNA-binding response regulator [Anaerolinea sp.]